MKIAIGNDGKGYALKLFLLEALQKQGYTVEDVGCHGLQPPVDYPDFARAVGMGVVSGQYERGILICGTGIGMSIAANKIPGVRAALCYEVLPAILTREHNDSNVLCTGGWMVTPEKALEVAIQWLNMRYAGGPHQARLDKISELERLRL
jgi:RpiB/LacA/LacB family sugar-phosphate isomerase